MKRPGGIFLILWMALQFQACSYQKAVGAKRASYAYNQAIKWRDYEKASSFLKKEDKNHLVANKEMLEKRLDLIEFEVLEANWEKERGLATVEVRKRFILYPDNTYREEIVKELWKKEEGGWAIQTPLPNSSP